MTRSENPLPSHSSVSFFERALNVIEKNLSWLPYLSIILLIIADINLSPILFQGNWASLFENEKSIGCVIALVLSVFIISSHLILCIKRNTRVKAMLAFGSSTIVSLIFFIIVENFFSPVFHYSEFQQSIQAQIDRRSKTVQETFCGVETQVTANSLGWIDKDRNITSSDKRIVFIGDSFLEIRSKKNVALRVEENLQSRNHPVEVINLSKTDTRPQPDYQHKFNEFAFDYNPDHIFIFIYSGNDLSTHYIHSPYKHFRYKVSQEAVNYLANAAINSDLLGKLHDVHNRGEIFKSKHDFLSQLHGTSQEYYPLNLSYLACLGYSTIGGISVSEKLFPNAVIRLKATRQEISNRLKRIRRSLKNKKKLDCACILDDEIRASYQSIFEQPEEMRLELIARFIADDYCQNSDYMQYHQILKGLDPLFIKLIINEPDGLGAIVPSVVGAASGEIKLKSVRPDRVERASTEYMKLFNEFYQIAINRGVVLTIVFIPVATNVDEQFIQFWQPLRGKGKGDGRGPPMVEAIKPKMDGKIPFIDLTDFSEQFQGCHWIFDGHWNEKGNETAAKILSNYILSDCRTLNESTPKM